MGKYSKFRIYGNTLGTMRDIILFLSTLERSYNYILMIDKLLSSSIHNYRLKSFMKEYDAYELSVKKQFIDFYKYMKLEDLISDGERLTVSAISFNSPGFWDVIGSLNPLSQIREYIQESYLRKRDKEFIELEKESKELANEKARLENNLLKLELTKTMVSQLQEIGLSEEEIEPIMIRHITNLNLLDSHVNSGRITNMEIINDDEI